MIDAIIQIMGGLGLFLLGMVILTDSLRSLTGDVMRRMLLRFTRTPMTGAITGTVTTAILQSSSATTVAAVGLVAAGSMGFAEALGIVFGANIGTTATGWLVVLLGFKFQIGAVLLPLILLGAVLKLFGHGRASVIGMAIAGFGVIFVGIHVMQQGAVPLQQWLTPESFPVDSFLGRLSLFLLGVLFSAVTQSSSAGVALALTAIHAGAISFPQAAALVVGMDVGTTVTTALATIGGTVGSRRTGLSHVIYNCMTGAAALLLITPYIMLWEIIAPGQLSASAEVALIAFHTSFNTLGVIAVLPVSHRFAALMERLIPETAPVYTRGLEKNLLQDPPLAINAAHAALREESQALIRHIAYMTVNHREGRNSDMVELKNELLKTQSYIDAIVPNAEDKGAHEKLVSLFHAMDHTQRLHDRVYKESRRAEILTSIQQAQRDCANTIEVLVEVASDIEQDKLLDAAERSATLAAGVSDHVDSLRNQVMILVAQNSISAMEGTRRLEALRWLDRVCAHIARLTHHLAALESNRQ